MDGPEKEIHLVGKSRTKNDKKVRQRNKDPLGLGGENRGEMWKGQG